MIACFYSDVFPHWLCPPSGKVCYDFCQHQEPLWDVQTKVSLILFLSNILKIIYRTCFLHIFINIIYIYIYIERERDIYIYRHIDIYIDMYI